MGCHHNLSVVHAIQEWGEVKGTLRGYSDGPNGVIFFPSLKANLPNCEGSLCKWWIYDGGMSGHGKES